MVEEYFEAVSDEPDWAPRYNIAPTQPVPVIRQHPKDACSAIVSGPLGLDTFMG
jgi:putative SOS response-associated peptidase YedK